MAAKGSGRKCEHKPNEIAARKKDGKTTATDQVSISFSRLIEQKESTKKIMKLPIATDIRRSFEKMHILLLFLFFFLLKNFFVYNVAVA